MHIATGEEEAVVSVISEDMGILIYWVFYISWGFKDEGTIIIAPLPKSAIEYWYQLYQFHAIIAIVPSLKK